MIRRMSTAVVATAVATVLMTSPAAADDGGPDYLDELQRIAGRSITYEAMGGAGARTLGLDPFTCTLSPSVVHIRTSSARRSVGAKPYTDCETGTPSLISQSSTLFIVEWAGAVYRPMATRTATSRGVARLEQKNVEWFCVNRNRSRFQQETTGYSVQMGRTYQSAVISRIDELACGY